MSTPTSPRKSVYQRLNVSTRLKGFCLIVPSVTIPLFYCPPILAAGIVVTCLDEYWRAISRAITANSLLQTVEKQPSNGTKTPLKTRQSIHSSAPTHSYSTRSKSSNVQHLDVQTAEVEAEETERREQPDGIRWTGMFETSSKYFSCCKFDIGVSRFLLFVCVSAV